MRKSFYSALWALMAPARAVEVSEELLLIGQFDAASLVSDASQLNITNSSSKNIYRVDADSGNVTIVDSLPDQLARSLPSIWQQTKDNSSVIVVDGKPYTLDGGSLSLLGKWDDQANGTVSALYYDEDDGLLYIGGDVAFNGTYGALVYDYADSSFHTLAFGGFNKGSKINAIDKYYESIIFGGAFDSIGEEQFLNISSSDNDDSNTHRNRTSVSNSTSVRDVSQMIPIDSSQVISSGGENAQQIICPSLLNPSPWTLPAGDLGYWQASLRTLSIPSKLRLYNSHDENQGVSLFRVVTSPANGIMNMTYIDPETLELKHCDEFCPLLKPSELSSDLADAGLSNYETFFHDNRTVLSLTDYYQDFAFVDLIGVESYQIQVLKVIGNNAALDGAELFRSGITVFAPDSLNAQSCATLDTYELNVHSETIGSTQWQNSNIGSYLTTTIPASQTPNNQIGLRYNIDIPVSGQYDVLLYTVGCAADNSCSQRGIMKATLYQGDGTQLSSGLIYQTNEQQKYDVLFSGDIEYSATDSAYIELTFDSSLNMDQETILTAGSAQFNYLQLDVTQYFKILDNDTDSSILELNNLFEYSLSNFSLDGALVDHPIGQTDLNMLTSYFKSSSSINGISINDTAIVLSGSFQSGSSDNVIGYHISGYGNDSLVLGDEFTIGSNINTVEGSFGLPDELILYGSTSLTNGDNDNLLLFQATNSSVQSLSAETRGSISSVQGFFYNDTEYLLIQDDDAENKSILFNLDQKAPFVSSPILNMSLSAAMKMNQNDSDSSFVMGNMVKFDTIANNIVNYQNGQLTPVKNSITNLGSAAYVNDSMTVVAGSQVYSLQKGGTQLLISDFQMKDNGFVNQVMYFDDTLYLALNGTGSYNSNNVQGIATYHMNNLTLNQLNTSIDGLINFMVIDPEFGSAIIGGNFSIPGKCTSLCTVDASDDQLFVSRTLASDLSGEVNWLNYFREYQVLIGGALKVGDQSGYLAVYNTTSGIVEISGLSDSLPGPVKQFLFANETSDDKSLDDQIIVLGDNYIGYLNGSSWTSLADGLDLTGSQLTGISLVDTESSPSGEKAAIVAGKALMLSGDFNLASGGEQVSNAIFDGQTWSPFAVTSNSGSPNNGGGIKGGNIIRHASMYVLSGSFSSTSSSSSSPKPTSTGLIDQKKLDYFSSGEVVGVSLALALGTILVLGVAAGLLFRFTGSKEDSIEEGDHQEEKMMEAVPPGDIM